MPSIKAIGPGVRIIKLDASEFVLTNPVINQLAGMTASEAESEIILRMTNFGITDVYVHVYTTSPLYVIIRVQAPGSNPPVGNWWEI